MARRPFTLTTRGVLAVCLAPLSAVAGLLLGAEELVLVAIALATLLFCGVVQSASRASRARDHWRISVELAANEAAVDGTVGMTITLAAAAAAASSSSSAGAAPGGGPPLWLEDPQHCWERVSHLEGTLGWRLPTPNPSAVVRVALPERGVTTRLRVLAPTGSRGVFSLREMRLWCFDSFGLVAQLVAVGPSATIAVHPTPLVVELDDEVLRGDRGMNDHEPFARLAHPKRDSFGDFAGLRTYVPGDRLRLLYWPALARTGELMVRDFEDDGPHRVHVVADIRPLIGEWGAESVLAAVAGVGLHVLAQGSVVELSTTAGERLAIGPGPHGASALLRAIAGIETVAPAAPSRWWRRRVVAPPVEEREPHPTAGTPLVVTTAAGVQALPGSFGLAHVVIAP